MAEQIDVRLALLSQTLNQYTKETAAFVAESMINLTEWKYLCPNNSARNTLTQSVYQRILEESQRDFYILFNAEAYGDVSSMIGFVEIIEPNTEHSIRDDLFTCISNLVLAPLHFEDGLSFIWRCIKWSSAIDSIRQDVMGKFIGNCWFLNHFCIADKLKSHGFGTKMLNLIHQKCAMSIKYANCPIFVIVSDTKSVQFFVKNGYKLVIDVSLDASVSCYGLIFHFDPKELQKNVKKFSVSTAYNRKYNVFEHLLPRSLIKWMMLINITLICLPFLLFYLPAIWLTRYLSPESAWDIGKW